MSSPEDNSTPPPSSQEVSLVPSGANTSGANMSGANPSVEPIDKIFDKIKSFLSDLNDAFGSGQISLQLYNRYLQTKVSTANAKIDHIEIFKKYINENLDAIMKKDASLLKRGHIVYTNKVNVKLDEIFKIADKETAAVIWNHLLVIYNAIDPSVEIVKMIKGSIDDKSKEGQVLGDIVNAMNNLGGGGSGDLGGLITNFTSGIQDGSIDVMKMFGMVGNMFNMMNGNMNQQGGGNPMGDIFN